MASSGDQGFCIDGTKTKLMADIETGFVDHPGATDQFFSVGGVSYQVLNISPSQPRALQEENREKRKWSASSLSTCTIS